MRGEFNASIQEFSTKHKVSVWSWLIFVLLSTLFIVLRFWDITAYSLWGGEAFTMIGAQKSWGGMMAYIVADIVHPPLIYGLLKVWIMIGGESLLWLKLLPVLSGAAVIVPFWFLCRELDLGLPEINLALLFTAVNGYLIHYTQELRMYSLFMFLALCSYWLFIRWLKTDRVEKGQLLWLTVINLLAIYTHYYGWVVVGMEFLFLLVWRRQKAPAFAVSMLALLVCFAPWAYLVVQEARSIGGLAQNLDWIPKPSIRDILNLYVTFIGPWGDIYPKLMGLTIFSLPLLFWGGQLIWPGEKVRKRDWFRFSCLAGLAFIPVIVLFAISQWMSEAVWVDRYFIFIAIPYMILTATAVYRIKPIWLRNGWIAAVVIWSLLVGFNDLRTNRMAWEGPQLGSRIDWDGLTQEMIAVEASTPGPITVYGLNVYSKDLFIGHWAISTSINYFMDMHGDERFQTAYGRDVYTMLDRAEDDHFWVVFFELTAYPQPSTADIITQHGYRVGEPLIHERHTERIVLLPVWRE